jgi:hypothetical protein
MCGITEQLRRRIAQADTAITGMMTELERLGSDTSPAAAAYRDRIRDQFTQRYDDKTAAQAELDALTDHETHEPARKNSSTAAIRTLFFRDHGVIAGDQAWCENARPQLLPRQSLRTRGRAAPRLPGP